MQHVVVVGASLAGVSATEALREHGFLGRITMIEATADLVHDRPPLSKAVLAGSVDVDECVLRDREWFQDNSVQLLAGRRVASVDTEARVLTLDDGSRIEFDGLVIATGLRARQGRWLPPHTPGVFTLRDHEDAANLREAVMAATSVAVIGGGFLGLEVAATVRSMGQEVTLIECEMAPLGRVLPPPVGEWFADLHRDHGVNVQTGSIVSEITESDSGLVVRWTERLGDHCETFDVVVVALGAEPETDWLVGSGIDLDNGVLCDSDLSTSVEGIVAAGDVARWHHPDSGLAVRIEHWTNAVEQGRHAAVTLLGNGEPFRSIPYFWTDQFDAKARFVGWASASHEVMIIESNPGSWVALFGSDGVLQGALCVNAPKELVRLRRDIEEGKSWAEVLRSEKAPGQLSATSLSPA